MQGCHVHSSVSKNSLITTPACLLQVATCSDLLFIFGGLAEVRDTIKEIKGDLKQQIVVPVTTDGNLDVFLVSLLFSMSCQ